MFHQPVKTVSTSVLNRSIKRSVSVVVAALIVFGCVARGLAGGFQLSVETPSGAAAGQLKGAVLLVRTFGCHTPADAKVSATAEGVVNGERRSLPLEVAYDSTGVYALKRQWPSEGSWVLAITGEYNSFTSTLIVDLGPNGNVHPGTRLEPGSRKGTHALVMPRKATTAEIDSALKAVAGNVSQLSPDGSIDSRAPRPAAWVVGGVGAFFFLVGFATLTRRTRSKSVRADGEGPANEPARG
jgi:hypothetical protein